MPRYFFNIQDGQDIADDTGTVCADAIEARAEAVVAAGEMLRDLDGRFWQISDWRMQVTDEQGATVCTLSIKGSMA